MKRWHFRYDSSTSQWENEREFWFSLKSRRTLTHIYKMKAPYPVSLRQLQYYFWFVLEILFGNKCWCYFMWRILFSDHWWRNNDTYRTDKSISIHWHSYRLSNSKYFQRNCMNRVLKFTKVTCEQSKQNKNTAWAHTPNARLHECSNRIQDLLSYVIKMRITEHFSFPSNRLYVII